MEVLDIDGDTCFIKYQGSLPIRMGVEAAVKDRFPGIKTVSFMDYEDAE